jgi:hypothetical protein
MKYSFLKPPQPTKYNVLSLGAGVQSSCMALMAAKGEITPMPDFAIFADTQAEPKSVYKWLNWLRDQLPFPVYTVTNGNLTESSLDIKKRKKDSENGIAKKGDIYVNNLIPLFGILPDGKKTAAIGRKCTADYKIKPIQQFVKKKCEIKRGQKETTVTEWIGISWDEIQRMKDSRVDWTVNRYPLIEMQMTREKCKEWMADNGYPEPPRSACYYCPFHSDEEWRRLRDDEPEYFKKALAFDKQIRQHYKDNHKAMKMEVYLHNSCKPLDQIDFDSDEDKGQMTWDFKAECEGMCGV